jgi:tetratricopeptide (TPR) repeat protein
MAATIWALTLDGPAQAQYREYFIRGKVVDTQKQPIAEVEIEISDTQTNRSFHMKTGKDGAFKFAGVPHGIYQARLTKQGYPPTKVEWRFEAPQDTMQRVEIPDIVLASQEQVEKVAQTKEAEAGTKEAAEKIRQHDFDAALALLKPLLDKNPKNPSALYFLGLSYVGKQSYREAAVALTQATELSPTLPGAFFELGICRQQLQDKPGALAAFEKSLELEPANADAAYNAGLLLFELDRTSEALARFEQSLAAEPQDPDVLEMVGRCHLHEGQLDKALEALQEARDLSTDAAKLAFLDELIRTTKAQSH